uniref:Doublecortin domain-containing protein n=1 Tax=Romanomermis culicivorax TaxID=13658 RepID=A0A915KDR0_ROMCU
MMGAKVRYSLAPKCDKAPNQKQWQTSNGINSYKTLAEKNGVRVPVSKARYRTMDSLLDDLNDKVPMQFGVRRLFTPRGKAEVKTLEELQHMGRYICSDSKWAVKRYAAVAEKFQQKLFSPDAHYNRRVGKSESSGSGNTSLPKAPEMQKRFRSPTNAHNIKQVVFLLNGNSSKSCRLQVRQTRSKLSFEDILNYVTDSLQVPIAKLYNKDGERIFSVEDILNGPSQFIACQKYEKFILNDNNLRLPAISNANANGNIPSTERLSRNVGKKAPNGHIPNTVSLPALSPTRKRIKKQLRTRTVSKKRKTVKASTVLDMQEESDDPDLHGHVVKIQTSIRGYLARKLHHKLKVRHKDETYEDGTENLKPSENGARITSTKEQTQTNLTEESTKHSDKQIYGIAHKYSVSVFTGNRWAAEMDADLYIILVGEISQTDKLLLKQEGEEPKFLQNQAHLKMNSLLED